MDTLTPASPGVRATSFTTPASDAEGGIELRWYAKADAAPGSAVVYAHGGGMIGGSLDLYDKVVSGYVAQTGVPFLSVGYRLAPEATSSTSLAEDVFTGLTWLIRNAADLGVDAARMPSWVTAAEAARPPGRPSLPGTAMCPLARQILIYPMLDDRNTTPGTIPAGSSSHESA
jgi:hypothetical protein